MLLLWILLHIHTVVRAATLVDPYTNCRGQAESVPLINASHCSTMLEFMPNWSEEITFWRYDHPGPPRGSFTTPYYFLFGTCAALFGVPDRAPVRPHMWGEVASFSEIKETVRQIVETCVSRSSSPHKGGGSIIGENRNLVVFLVGQSPNATLPRLEAGIGGDMYVDSNSSNGIKIGMRWGDAVLQPMVFPSTASGVEKPEYSAQASSSKGPSDTSRTNVDDLPSQRVPGTS